MPNLKPVPDGYHTVTPHLVLDECAKAIEFYKQAFGATEQLRMPGPGGKIVHAEIRIGDSVIMLNDEMPPMAGQPGVFKSPRSAGLSTAAVFLYVEDVDAAFDRALKAGCTVRMPLDDMFWGDRYGQVIDPFGHTWAMATHKEDLRPEQIAQRQKEFLAKMQPARA
jgi:PhnB protein